MKFLVTANARDTYFDLSEEVRGEIFDDFNDNLDKLLKSGKCKEFYYIMMQNTASIWEVESAEELDSIFVNLKIYSFLVITTNVLSDWKSHAESLKNKSRN